MTIHSGLVAVELMGMRRNIMARCRRGVEPLLIVIMPQQDQQATTSTIIEPMPVVV